MSIALASCPITVTDVEESLAFYRDALGLEVLTDVNTPGGRWLTLGIAAQPGLVVMLSAPAAGRSEAEADALQELVTKGSMPPLIFSVDDVDQMFEQVRASGAGEVLQEPVDQPWGPRDCAFRDPSGNMIRFDQRR